MKKLVLSALLFAFTIGAAEAQSSAKMRNKQASHKKAANSSRPDQVLNQVYDRLQLNNAQRARAAVLNNSLKNNFRAVTSGNLTADQKRAQALTLVQRHQAEFRNMLTPAQNQNYQYMLSDLQRAGMNTGASSIAGLNGMNLNSLLSAFLGTNTASLAGLFGNNFTLGSILGVLGSIPLDAILSILFGR